MKYNDLMFPLDKFHMKVFFLFMPLELVPLTKSYFSYDSVWT